MLTPKIELLMFFLLIPTDYVRSESEIHHLEKREAKKCMEELGCFEITADFFHPIFRPYNVLPADRGYVNTRFLLFTRRNRIEPQIIKANKTHIKNSFFNPKWKTVFIIHGMTDKRELSLNESANQDLQVMGNAFLTRGEYNAFVVDWSGGSTMPYPEACANAQVAGAEIALLVNFLKDNYSLDPKSVHLIGFSLGGQVVGYAGERIRNLGRITALDPAMPYFQNMPPSVRIDPTDALFVDVIYTDSKTFVFLGPGMSQPCGHVDFYPNNGNNHPGCSIFDEGNIIPTEGLVNSLLRLGGCNHMRAFALMLDSILEQQCRPISFACSDWESFKAGHCTSCGSKGELCASMGFKAIDFKPFVKGNESTIFYTITGAKSPFCTYMYQVQVKLQNSQGQSRKGSLKLTVKGTRNIETFNNLAGGNIDLHPGATYRFLITTSQIFGAINISFGWDRSTWIIGSIFKHYIFVENIKITPLNEPDAKVREEMSSSFFAKTKGALESGQWFDLHSTRKSGKVYRRKASH